MEDRIDSLFYERIAFALNNRRETLMYSYKKLAQLTGLTHTMLIKYLNGKFRISNKNFELICKALDLEPSIHIELSVGRKG